MKVPLLSDIGLAQAIKVAVYNLQHPENFLQRWQQEPKWIQTVYHQPAPTSAADAPDGATWLDELIETQTLQLSLLMELQHRREVNGPLNFAGFDVEDVGSG